MDDLTTKDTTPITTSIPASEMTADTVDLGRYYRLDELEAMPIGALDELWQACPDKAFYEQALEDAIRSRFGRDAIVTDLQRLEVINQAIDYYLGDPPRIPMRSGWFKVPRRVIRHLETGEPLVNEKPAETKKFLSKQVVIGAAVGIVGLGCITFALISRVLSSAGPTPTQLTSTAAAAAQVAEPQATFTPTALALDNIDRPIKAGDDVRGYYPVILEIKPAVGKERVFPVQQKEVKVAEWQYADDPDVASAVLGLVIRPVIGIPYTPDNATFLESLDRGDQILLRMSTGSTLEFTLSNVGRIDRQDTSIFQQTSPGVVLAMLRDIAGDRLVITGTYPTGQEQAEGAALAGNTGGLFGIGQPVDQGDTGITVTVLDAYTSTGPVDAELPPKWAYLLVDLQITTKSQVDTGAFALEIADPTGVRYSPVAIDTSIANLQPFASRPITNETSRSTIGFLIPRTLRTGALSLQVSPDVPATHYQLAFHSPIALTARNLDAIVVDMETKGTTSKPVELIVRVRLFNPFQQDIVVRPGDVFAIYSPVVLKGVFPTGPTVQPTGVDLPVSLERGQATDLEFHFAWQGDPFVGLRIGGYSYIATLR